MKDVVQELWGLAGLPTQAGGRPWQLSMQKLRTIWKVGGASCHRHGRNAALKSELPWKCSRSPLAYELTSLQMAEPQGAPGDTPVVV